MKKISSLRKKYPKFVYNNYFYRLKGNNLEISFEFFIEPDIYFKPKVLIRGVNVKRVESIGIEFLDNLVFHLGLIEVLSYWKSTCSPEIEIRAGELKAEQIRWFKNLIINGMGQFFYENKIDWRKKNFLEIKCNSKVKLNPYLRKLKRRVLIPVGGGKDSVVTLEILKKRDFNCFSLNPTEPAKKIMKLANCKNPIIVKREVDKRLLELNRKGFLNGHTPFSAYLAFLTVLLAVIFDYKYIAVSNERSSNEGNLKYLGKTINHQYSKSFNFEKKFKLYREKYLVKDAEYFSFLRPLYEIQIAKLFSKYPKYFSSFLSCNEAFKTNSGRITPKKKWCGKCSKCLFVYAMLYPFLEKKEIMKIFGKDLFADKELLRLMKQLIGIEKTKPLECVGTRKESLVAFYLSWKKTKQKNKPFLLKYFEKKILPKFFNLEKESEKILNSWNKENNLPKDFKNFLF